MPRLRRGEGGAQREPKGRPEGVNIAAVAAATPHINIPGKSARVKHLFSTRGFSKWRESGCSNSAEATITRLAGRLSICILSTEEFITASAFSLDSFSFSRSFSPSYLYIDHPPVVIVIGGISARWNRFACRMPILFRAPDVSLHIRSRVTSDPRINMYNDRIEFPKFDFTNVERIGIGTQFVQRARVR